VLAEVESTRDRDLSCGQPGPVVIDCRTRGPAFSRHPPGWKVRARPARGPADYGAAVREDRIVNDGVPARVYDPGNGRGLLLFGPGGGHSKDSDRFVSLSRHYARRTGLAVVCMDAVDHGERKPPQVSPALPAGWRSQVSGQMVADWQTTASALSSLGVPLAYVGFSMGMIFGAPTVAAIPTIQAAVFGVGGIPAGEWLDDSNLEPQLLAPASGLDRPEVLMLNVTEDEFFPRAGTHRFFDAIPGHKKRLMFWPGSHDHWPDEAIRQSVDFVNSHVG